MNRILILSFLLVAVCLTTDAQSSRRRALMAQRVAAGAVVDSPDDIANLFAWYKSDALLTNLSGTTPPADEENIQSWGDSSGNGRHLTTNNPTAVGPKFQNTAATGKSFGGVEFVSGAYLRVGFAAQAQTTIFIVWKNNNSGSTTAVLDSTNSSSLLEIYKSSGIKPSLYAGSVLATTDSVANNTWNTWGAVFNGSGDDTMYTNGVQSVTGTAGSASLDGLTIMTTATGTAPMITTEYIGEIVIYSRNLNSTEIGQVFTYLNGRWATY